MIIGNPPQSRRSQYINDQDWFLPELTGKSALMVRNSIISPDSELLRQKLAAIAGKVDEVSRGLIRCGNNWRNCDASVTVGAGFFDGVHDLGMITDLQQRSTIPAAELWDAAGNPQMNKRRFCCREVQELFLKSYIASLYQTLWRTALCDGKPVVAIVALPNVVRLAKLYRLMPLELISVIGDET